MAGDIEHRAVSPELDLEEPLPWPLSAMKHSAPSDQLFGGFLRVVDQNAEVMNASEIHAPTDLIGLELEDGDVERAVTWEKPCANGLVGLVSPTCSAPNAFL
jgi:hypothetical protein